MAIGRSIAVFSDIVMFRHSTPVLHASIATVLSSLPARTFTQLLR